MKAQYVLCTVALLALLASAASVGAAASPSNVPDATTKCFQDGVLPTAAYAGTLDAYIRESQPTTNYGATTQLTVDGGEGARNTDRWALIKWDVSAIPAGSSVTAAVVTFNVTDDGTTQTYHQYELTGAWDEMAVKWNMKPAWGGGSLGPMGPFGAGTQTVNLAAAVVQKWVDTPAVNYGLIMADSTNTSGFDFYSSEAASASNRPKLCVTYTSGGGASANIIKGPYLQNPTTKSITILWESDGNVACQLRHRQHTTPPPAWTTVNGITPTSVLGKYLYAKPLTGVKSYEDYQVSCNGGATWVPDSATCRKALGATSTSTFTIAAYGDSRWDEDLTTYEHKAVVESMVKDKPRIALHVGDIVETGQCYDNDGNSDDKQGWYDEYFKPAESLVRQVAVFPVAGNHEYKTGCTTSADHKWYYDYFNVPDNGKPGQAAKWYAFTYGCARFIGLNTYDTEDNKTFSFSQTQQDWLNDEMNSALFTDAKWQIVFLHTPLHQWPNDSPRYLRTTIQTLFKDKGVDMVLEGHIHRYERGVQDGIQYVITGGGGAPLDDCATNPMPGRITCAKTYQYTTLKFACGSPTSLTFRALKSNRTLIEPSFILTRAAADGGVVLIENVEPAGFEAPVEEEVIEMEPYEEDAGEDAPGAPSLRLWMPLINHRS